MDISVHRATRCVGTVMSRTHRSLGPLCVAIVATMAVSGCTIKKSDAPALTGPSELGTSISIFANPDVLAQDGASQSQIVVQARDANGQAIRDLGLRAEIWVNGIPTDFGRLSARNVVTGPDGRASFAYTAPAPPPDPVDTLTIVTIVVVPTGTDFANAVARQVNIRLAPPGVILPPNGTPVARFTYSPTSISQGDTIQFDASSTSDDGQIVSFGWDFGDGTTGSGMRTTHAFS
ncbi:MAG: PKD domain-containing protein, partial [Acidobacteria bacterium]|nr:PKD domain-containing protein [Acidobacteriota bacterium]